MTDHTEQPEQIDRDAARKAAAMVHPYSHNSALILDGERDGTDIVQAALHGVRLGIEQGKRMAGGDRYRHKKRGTIYTMIGEAELQMSFDNLVDGSEMAVYRGEDGKLWVRQLDEFHDGRFEPLTEQQEEG